MVLEGLLENGSLQSNCPCEVIAGSLSKERLAFSEEEGKLLLSGELGGWQGGKLLIFISFSNT